MMLWFPGEVKYFSWALNTCAMVLWTVNSIIQLHSQTQLTSSGFPPHIRNQKDSFMSPVSTKLWCECCSGTHYIVYKWMLILLRLALQQGHMQEKVCLLPESRWNHWTTHNLPPWDEKLSHYVANSRVWTVDSNMIVALGSEHKGNSYYNDNSMEMNCSLV